MAGTPHPRARRASSAHGSDQYESETGVAPPPDPRDPHAELAQLTGLLRPPGGDRGSLTRQVERYEQWGRASRAVNGWDAYRCATAMLDELRRDTDTDLCDRWTFVRGPGAPARVRAWPPRRLALDVAGPGHPHGDNGRTVRTFVDRPDRPRTLRNPPGPLTDWKSKELRERLIWAAKDLGF